MNLKENYLKYKNIIKSSSCRWKLTEELISSLIFFKSKFNEEKLKFDENYYNKYISKFDIPEEEKKWRATKIGLLQITGQQAREIGYREYRGDFIDPVINLYFGLKLFTKNLKINDQNVYKTIKTFCFGLGFDGKIDHFIENMKEFKEIIKNIT